MRVWLVCHRSAVFWAAWVTAAVATVVAAVFLPWSAALITSLSCGVVLAAVLVRRARRRRSRAPERSAGLAGDLHDVIGLGLSAITLKAELASHLIGRDDDKARREVCDVLDIARQSIADVRKLSREASGLSVLEELTVVRGLLISLGVKVTVLASPGPFDRQVDHELAVVLREAVTNLLRHSAARRCSIRLRNVGDRTRLSVSNDGASPVPADTAGTGVANLQRRMAALGGRLDTSYRRGWFRLEADCPAVIPANRHHARSEQRRVDYAR